jgi:hypothetical protein
VKKPTVILVMEGGVVQNVLADAGVDVLCIDYDGAEDEDAVEIPQDEDLNSGNTERATFGRLLVQNDPKRVKALVPLMTDGEPT